jgi:hypothetical protein
MREFHFEEDFREWFENPCVYHKYGIKRILWSQNDFPDLKIETMAGRIILAEVEVKTSNFDSHKHDEDQVDVVIVWLHDQPYRKRHFKVYDVSLNALSNTPMKLDDVIDLNEDLVYQQIKGLPLIAVSSLNVDDFRFIKRYMKAWKTINQQDAQRFFTSDLDDVVKEFKSCVEVSKEEFLNRARHLHDWFPNRVFHPVLCFMAKAIAIRGTLQLIKEGILPMQKPNNDPVTDVYSVSEDQYTRLRWLEHRRKIPFMLGTYPFSSYEEKGGFCADYLDAFIGNFNFRASSRLPTVEVGLTLQELSTWERYGKKDLSEIEALNQYGLKRSHSFVDEFNPMKLEFSPSRVVSSSWKLASELKDYGFVEPDCREDVIKRIYDLVIQPIGVITHADKMPKADDIEFYFYPQNRIDDVLRRAETTIGHTKRDGAKYLRRFYQKYPLRFKAWRCQ